MKTLRRRAKGDCSKEEKRPRIETPAASASNLTETIFAGITEQNVAVRRDAH